MRGPDSGAEPVHLWPPGALLVVWGNKSQWEEPWPGSKGARVLGFALIFHVSLGLLLLVTISPAEK